MGCFHDGLHSAFHGALHDDSREGFRDGFGGPALQAGIAGFAWFGGWA